VLDLGLAQVLDLVLDLGLEVSGSRWEQVLAVLALVLAWVLEMVLE